MSTPQILTHMAANDMPLFASYFLSPEGQAYTAWEFDVIVGDPEEPGAFFPASVRRQALYLNALKIDAVGWFFGTPTLIECKPRAGLSAIGQVEGYQAWYRIIFGVEPSKMIVCQRMSRQIETLCTLSGIAVRRVEPATLGQVDEVIQRVSPLIAKKSILPQFAAVLA